MPRAPFVLVLCVDMISCRILSNYLGKRNAAHVPTVASDEKCAHNLGLASNMRPIPSSHPEARTVHMTTSLPVPGGDTRTSAHDECCASGPNSFFHPSRWVKFRIASLTIV
ncbi:uncharacterized protein EI90DRAFT_3068991 [Cantharellus anzutake]|uniref:uncharacterized protein n=1 Tax=Cantharellus anzutake TaxID=1750568 RepID=UPI001904A6A4|nr:uncharacterized protein EI90DRAFT_3068991 [Cantharellus anzutake]KAF8327041.1 hypothetical protein EI90DRAFT_3068991 [Cantharellus anzutake]